MEWELRIKKFVYYGSSLKNLIFGLVRNKKQYTGGFSKKGGFELFADLRGGLTKKWVVFLRGIDTQMHIMGN